MIAADTRLKLINNELATMLDIARLAQAGGVAVVECRGELALCNAREIPTGWRRFAIHQKLAA